VPLGASPQEPAAGEDPETTPEPSPEPQPEPVQRPESASPPKAKVKGALDANEVRQIVRSNIPDVQACYEETLRSRPGVEGRVTVQFAIGADGRVLVAVVAESSVGDATLDACVVEAVKGWVFPEPRGGGNVVVTYPFVFEAES
jgi:TonB family protein